MFQNLHMARIRYLRSERCCRLRYQRPEEDSPFLLLALRLSLVFPSHQCGKKGRSCPTEVSLLCESGVRGGKTRKPVRGSRFKDPVSFGAIDQVLINHSQKKKYCGESHKNTYVVSLFPD